MTRIATILLCLLASSAAPAAKPARPGAPAVPACGIKALPMVVGNTWTWKAGAQQLTLKVVDVSPGKDWSGKPATVITVEEVFQGRTIKNQISCTADKGMIVPLDSILFTGEPGGGVATTLNIKDRDNVTFVPDAGLVDGNGWVEKVKVDAVRTDADGAGAKHAPAVVELERHVHVEAGNTEVVSAIGQWSNAKKVVFELRGRGEVGAEKTEIPIKRPGVYYIVSGIGIVKMDDAFDKTWTLVESNLVK